MQKKLLLLAFAGICFSVWGAIYLVSSQQDQKVLRFARSLHATKVGNSSWQIRPNGKSFEQIIKLADKEFAGWSKEPFFIDPDNHITYGKWNTVITIQRHPFNKLGNPISILKWERPSPEIHELLVKIGLQPPDPVP